MGQSVQPFKYLGKIVSSSSTMIINTRNILTIVALNLFHIVQAQTIIPFELYEDKYILINIPGPESNDSMVFYFDTGASTTLMDKKVAEKHNLKADYRQNVPGASGNKSYDIATKQKIYLTRHLFVENVNVVLEDLTRLNGSLGKKFDGIIGYDILKNYITKIDFDKKKIYLYPFKEKLHTTEFSEINFTFKNGIPIPQFPVTIELLNGEKFSDDIFFDSGAGLLLMLNTPFQEKNNIIKQVGKTVSSTNNNLSDKSVTTLSVIKSLEIATYKFEGKLPITISSDKAGVSSYSGYLGILGSEIINRFNIILDYSTLKLYLKPNELYHKEFVTAVSPIKLSLIDGAIIISGVTEGTEAYLKGLREGQTIVSINGITTSGIEKYRKMLLETNKVVVVKYVDKKNEIKESHFKIEKIF